MLLREELDSSVSSEQCASVEQRDLELRHQPVQNRFSGDCVALHMMVTVARLTDQRAASYHNGGTAFAKRLENLTAEDLASAARTAPDAGGMDEFLKEAAIPQTVKDALHAMRSASAAVAATDGHRRLCLSYAKCSKHAASAAPGRAG